MAENSRMSKLSSKEDEYIFSWKLFTGWDFMIGNKNKRRRETNKPFNDRIFILFIYRFPAPFITVIRRPCRDRAQQNRLRRAGIQGGPPRRGREEEGQAKVMCRISVFTRAGTNAQKMQS